MSVADDYRAIHGTLWRGPLARWPRDGGAHEDPVADDTWVYRELGQEARYRLRVWAPVQRAGRWYAPIHVTGIGDERLLVPGASAVLCLLNACRVLELHYVDFRGADARLEGAPLGEAAENESWRAPDVAAIDPRLAADRWAVGWAVGQDATERAVVVGPPGTNPNDPGTRVCYVQTPATGSPRPVYGVGLVDTLRNATKVVASYLHTCADVRVIDSSA